MVSVTCIVFLCFSAAVAKPHRHSTTQTPAPRLHQSLPDVVPPTCHNHGDGSKRVPCGGSERKSACRKSLMSLGTCNKLIALFSYLKFS